MQFSRWQNFFIVLIITAILTTGVSFAVQNKIFFNNQVSANQSSILATISNTQNEANQIKKLGGLLIRIEPHDKWDPGIYWNHPSETDLDEYADFDLIIHPKFGEIEKNLKIIKQFIEK